MSIHREPMGKKPAALWMLLIALLATAAPLSAQDAADAPRQPELPRTDMNTAPADEPSRPNTDELRLLIWEGHAPKAWVERFEQGILTRHKRPVKLKISYATEDNQFFDAIRDRAVDIVMMTHHEYKDERFQYIQKHLLLPIDLANVPNYPHLIPALQHADYQEYEGLTYAVPVSQGPFGLAYNPERLAEKPQSWNIFWDPRFQGQYVLSAHDYLYLANITALAMGYPRESLGNYEALNNPEFKKRFRELALNAHSFWVGVETADALAGRPLAVAWGDSFGPLKARNENWQFAEPVEGTVCWIDNYAITWAVKDNPFLKRVAEEYINELLSTDYQVGHILRHMSLSPIIANIKPLLTPEETSRLHIDSPNHFAKNRILQKTLSQRDRNGIELLWKEAMQGVDIKAGSHAK